MNYWHNVPKGVWTVTDPDDALEALRDQESRAVYNSVTERIHILGPQGTALIVDLKAIQSLLNEQEYQEFFRKFLMYCN